MSKISFKNKKGKIIIINKLSYPETINQRIFDAINSKTLEGFLSISVYQKRKETRLECEVEGLVTLREYFSGIVTKKMFLDMVYQIVLLIKDCEKNMINPNNLDLQSDRIFVDLHTKKTLCIFWPIVNNQRENPVHLFFKQIPYEFKFNPHEETDYLEEYKRFFDGITPFSIKSFEALIMRLQGKKILSGYAPSGDLNVYQDRKTKYQEIKKNSIEYDPFACQEDEAEKSSIVCTSCGQDNPFNAICCMKCGYMLKQEDKKSYGTIDCNEISDLDTRMIGEAIGGATNLDYNAEEKIIFPTLLRLRTKEVFIIYKPLFRIGKDRKWCDLCICDNNHISRNHADIITKNGRYYIIDRKSTNKTFVAGKAIPFEVEVELFSGTDIRLANESFLFSIES